MATSYLPHFSGPEVMFKHLDVTFKALPVPWRGCAVLCPGFQPLLPEISPALQLLHQSSPVHCPSINVTITEQGVLVTAVLCARHNIRCFLLLLPVRMNLLEVWNQSPLLTITLLANTKQALWVIVWITPTWIPSLLFPSYWSNNDKFCMLF